MNAFSGKLGSLHPSKATIQIIGLLTIAPVLLTTGPLVASFSPFLAVALSWLWFMLPGFFLSSVLLRRLSFLERIPVSFVLGVGLASPYTVVAILLRMKLNHFLGLSICTFFLTVLIFLILNLRARLDMPNALDNSSEIGLWRFEVGMIPYLCFLILVAGLLAFLSSQWPPAGDDLAGLPHFQEVLRLGKITGAEPFHGTGTFVTPRNELIVWGYQAILICKIASTSAVSFFMNSRPILIVLAFLALYTFIHQSFKDRHQALFVLSLWAVYLLTTTRVEGAGSDLITRIFHDKFHSWFIAVPIILVFMQWFLESRQRRYLVVLGLGAFGTALLHPISLIQVMILVGSFGLLHLAFERSRRAFSGLVPVALILILCLAIPIVQYFRYLGRMPVELAGLGDAVELGRISMATNRYRLWLLDGNRYILHPSIFLQPVILLGYLLLPLLVLRLRESSAARLIIGSMLALPLLLYVPPLFAIISKFTTPFLMWRLAWPLPTFSILTIGWAIWLAVSRLSRLVDKHNVRGSVVHYASPLAIVGLALFVGRPRIETGLVNFRERLSAEKFSTCSKARNVLLYLDQLAYQEPVDVLASRRLNLCIPGYAALANVVEFRGYGTVNRLPSEQIAESLRRVDDIAHFSSTTMIDDLVVATIERYAIDYVLVEKDRIDLDLQLRHLPTIFAQLYSDPDYTLYSVTKRMLHSPIIDGNTAIRQRRWDEAEEIFNQVVEEDPTQILAHLGLAMVHEGRGEIEQAVASYLEARRHAHDEPAVHARLAETYVLVRDAQQAVNEYRRAVILDPEREGLHASLGLAHLLAGDENAARASFERAVALQAEVGAAAYYSILGATMNSVSWPSEAVESYRKAIALEPDPLRYVNLALALAQSGDTIGAMEADEEAIQRDHWLDLPHLHLGRIYQSQGRLEAAIHEYERAWRLNPASDSTYILLGQTIQEKSGVGPASIRLESLLTLNRVLPGPHRGLAPLYAARGELETALGGLNFSFRVRPRDASIKVAMGDLLREGGQYDRAWHAYEEALAVDPGMLYARLGLSYLYGKDAEVELQFGQLLRVARLAPAAAWPRVALGNAYQSQGKSEEARAEIEWSIRLEPTNSASYVALGSMYASKAEWEAAISAYQRAIELQPANTDAYLELGQVHLALGDLTAASESFEAAAKVSPAAAEVRVAVGGAYRLQGDLTRAIAEYRRAIEAQPGYTGAYVALSNALQARGDLTAAMDVLRQAIEVVPSSPESYRALAEIARLQARADEALAWARKGIEASSQEASSYMALAEVYEQRGEGDLAAEAYQQAIRLEPTSVGGYIQLAALCESRGDFAGAEAQYRAGTQAVPLSGQGYVALGNYYARRGDGEWAIEAYQHAQRAEPAYIDAYRALADLYRKMGRFDKALAQYLAATQIVPGATSAWTALGSYYQERGQLEAAMAAFQRAIQVQPANVSAWLTLGFAHQSCADLGLALDAYRQVLALEPANPAGYLALGQLEEARGNRSVAEEFYRQAIAAVPSDARSYLHLGSLYVAVGEQEKAVTELQAAVEVAPVYAPALVALGDWYRDQGQGDEAEWVYRQAIEVAPAQVDGYLALGQLEERRGNRDVAEELYRQAIVMAPADPSGHLSLAALYGAEGRYEEAQAQLQAAVEVAPVYAPALVALGDWHRDRSQWDEAERAYRQALEVAPVEVEGYLALGQLEERRGNRDVAGELYRQAIEVAPADVRAYISLGGLYQAQGEQEEGLGQLLTAVGVAPASGLARISLGNAYRHRGSLDSAVAEYEHALSVAPDASHAYTALIEVHHALGQPERALAWAEAAVERNPASAWAEVILGDLYARQGQAEKALEAYHRAATKEPGSVEAQTVLGWAYLIRGSKEEAMEAFEEALTLQPGDASIHLALASAWFMENQIEAAITELETAISLDLTSVESYHALGDFHSVRDRFDEAIQAYQQALAADAHNVYSLIAIGETLEKQGKTTEAIEKYRTAAQLDRHLASGELALGKLYLALADYNQAVEAYRRGIATQPGDVRLYVELAKAFEKAGKPEEALEQCNVALEVNPGSASAHTVKADILARDFGEVDEALSIYEQAVQIDPRHTHGYAETAQVHLREKQDLVGFILQYEAIGQANPDQTWVYGMLAYAYGAMDAVREAISAFEHLLGLVPDYADAHCDLAELYERVLQRQPAIDHWSTCAALAIGTQVGADAQWHRDQLNHIVIVSPSNGATVGDRVEIRGSAWIDQFQFYKVEFGAGEQPTSWSVIGDIYTSPVIDGVLTTWDTGSLQEGVYALRLTVVDNTGNVRPFHQMQVTVRRIEA